MLTMKKPRFECTSNRSPRPISSCPPSRLVNELAKRRAGFLRQTMTQKSTRGGSRANSGRKPDPNKKIAITKKLDRRIVAYLKQCDNATEVIETAIENSEPYKEWQKNRAQPG